MYPGLNVAEFVNALLNRLADMKYSAPRRALAEQVGVDVGTVAKWIRGDTSRLQEKSLKALVDFAAACGIYVEAYSRGPSLWPAYLPYEEMLRQQQDDIVFPPARLDHIAPVRVFERFLQSPFGVAAGPATAHPRWCEHLLKSGAGFLELATVMHESRDPREEPTLFRLLQENPRSTADPEGIRCGLFRPRSYGENIADGLGSNVGQPSPKPGTWVDGLKGLLQRANDRQVILPSVTGSPWLLQDSFQFIDSLVRISELAVHKAESPFLVVNISCLSLNDYFLNPASAAKALGAVRETVGKQTVLLVKIGAWSEAVLLQILPAIAPFIDGLIAINSVPFRCFTEHQRQRQERGVIGLSGKPILNDALATVELLKTLRDQHAEFRRLTIIGCGGITKPEDVEEFLSKGAALTAAQTAVLQDPYFIWKVHSYLGAEAVRQQNQIDQAEEVVAGEFGRALWLLQKKYGHSLKSQSFPDSSLLRLFRELVASSQAPSGAKRRNFRYAKDILSMIEQTLLQGNRKSDG